MPEKQETREEMSFFIIGRGKKNRLLIHLSTPAKISFTAWALKNQIV